MQPFASIDPQRAGKIRYVLCDIDDTITTNGKLPAESYSALWRLRETGYGVIPVTGRPAGWCDLIVRQWPVAAVVGENGAFVYYFRDGHRLTFTHPTVAEGDIQGRLAAVRDACLAGVPGSQVSKDQFARIYDLAIDFNEDPPYLGLEAAEKIREIAVSMGAVAKVSSIHVNAWFGDYNKLDMTRLFMKEVMGEDDDAIREKVLFFGDSPNDEPMFAFFPNSCGVANVKPFVERMTHLPAFVTAEESGKGFAEAVERLLEICEK